MSRRFARNGWPRGSEVYTSGVITAHATPHTKGDWVDIDASIARDICGFYIAPFVVIGSSGVDTSMLLDIGVGSTGNAVDQIKVNNMAVGGWAANIPIFVPLHIRAGERLAARIQSAVTLATFNPRIVLCFADRPPGWGGYSEADTYTANTATSQPTTGDLADNAWDEAVASTTNSIKALTFHPCTFTNALAAVAISVDVGVGSAGNEVVVGSWYVFTTASEIVSFMGPPFIEVAIAAGSRLAIRKNDTNNLSGLVIGWR